MNKKEQKALTNLVNVLPELLRLNFVQGTQGKEAALVSARQTILVYKASLKFKKKSDPRRHFARLPEYRRKFIASIYICEKYIAFQENKNEL